MAIDRTPREKETRAATVHQEAWRPPGAFPTEIIGAEPGYRYRFVRTFYNGADPDKGNVVRRMSSGWRPVKAEELPAYDYLKDDSGNLTLGGTILCKNSEESVQKAVSYYENQATGQLEGAASEFENSQDPRMPKFSEGNLRTRVIRGR